MAIFRCSVVKTLLNSICYVGEIIFKLIMKENNMTSLLGENIFVTSLNTFFPCMENITELHFSMS